MEGAVGLKKYVQHVSRQGEKWEVVCETEYDYQVYAKHSVEQLQRHYLPKSEYALCDPPEVWVDVSGRCNVNQNNALVHNEPAEISLVASTHSGYRLRKVKGNDLALGGPHYAFIIERKQP
jgi:hypothetical protein